ncbi:MAG: 50S ribosomal protein L18 [bacterium]|nr:50S ribosomal protein L18 [bacterium]
MKSNSENRITRHKRIRAKVKGDANRPRLSVFRSNKYISAQLIDDEKGVTLGSASSRGSKGKKMEIAKGVGKAIASEAVKKGHKKVVFDRSGYKFAGNVKAVAEGAREAGLSF